MLGCRSLPWPFDWQRLWLNKMDSQDDLGKKMCGKKWILVACIGTTTRNKNNPLGIVSRETTIVQRFEAISKS